MATMEEAKVVKQSSSEAEDDESASGREYLDDNGMIGEILMEAGPPDMGVGEDEEEEEDDPEFIVDNGKAYNAEFFELRSPRQRDKKSFRFVPKKLNKAPTFQRTSRQCQDEKLLPQQLSRRQISSSTNAESSEAVEFSFREEEDEEKENECRSAEDPTQEREHIQEDVKDIQQDCSHLEEGAAEEDFTERKARAAQNSTDLDPVSPPRDLRALPIGSEKSGQGFFAKLRSGDVHVAAKHHLPEETNSKLSDQSGATESATKRSISAEGGAKKGNQESVPIQRSDRSARIASALKTRHRSPNFDGSEADTDLNKSHAAYSTLPSSILDIEQPKPVHFEDEIVHGSAQQERHCGEMMSPCRRCGSRRMRGQQAPQCSNTAPDHEDLSKPSVRSRSRSRQRDDASSGEFLFPTNLSWSKSKKASERQELEFDRGDSHNSHNSHSSLNSHASNGGRAKRQSFSRRRIDRSVSSMSSHMQALFHTEHNGSGGSEHLDILAEDGVSDADLISPQTRKAGRHHHVPRCRSMARQRSTKANELSMRSSGDRQREKSLLNDFVEENSTTKSSSKKVPPLGNRLSDFRSAPVLGGKLKGQDDQTNNNSVLQKLKRGLSRRHTSQAEDLRGSQGLRDQQSIRRSRGLRKLVPASSLLGRSRQESGLHEEPLEDGDTSPFAARFDQSKRSEAHLLSTAALDAEIVEEISIYDPFCLPKPKDK